MSVHRRARQRAGVEVYDLGPCSSAGVLAGLAIASFGHLVQVIRHGLEKIQYRPGFVEGCLAGTGLTLDLIQHSTDIMNERSFNERAWPDGRS